MPQNIILCHVNFFPLVYALFYSSLNHVTIKTNNAFKILKGSKGRCFHPKVYFFVILLRHIQEMIIASYVVILEQILQGDNYSQFFRMQLMRLKCTHKNNKNYPSSKWMLCNDCNILLFSYMMNNMRALAHKTI